MIDHGSRRPAELERLRRRTLATLIAGVALGSTGHIAAITVSTIVARDLAGSAAWSGAPGAAIVLGAAVGAVALSRIMVGRGRRVGLVTGYGIGVVGALVATGSVLMASLPLLLVGMLLIGFGNASNQLSRYTAADLVAPERRASAIGLVVWGATVGAIVGPSLAAPAGVVATALGFPPLSGAFLLPVVFVGAAAVLSFVLLRPDPYDLADGSSRREMERESMSTAASLATILSRPSVAVAVVALIAGQFVMVLIMTMTPLHMADHGHDLAAIGIVISGHTFGMFGLSPLSGRLTDRFGSVAIILVGLGTVAVAAVLAAAAPPAGGVGLFLALFLLGFGWNLGYVAGSTLLTTGLSLAERTRVQGVADALIWSSAAVASLGSGLVLTVAGYTILGLMGGALVVAPMMLVIARRSAVQSRT